MRFVGGTSLSESQLTALSAELVQRHGENARDVVNAYIDSAIDADDHVEHAKWVNVSLGVIKILRR